MRSVPNPDWCLYLPRKSKFRTVFYTEIPDTVDHIDLGEVLEEQWDISPPEAIIAITGISHQFNIKDKRNLKKDLIEAVKSTGSWIVTCGTESGVVQFIEDAVDDHVALKKIYIPIVGILSKRVLDEIKPLKGAFKVKETNDKIPTKSTKETLDPNHTQFVVLGDPSINLPRDCASSECRNAFQSFLSNIKDADFKTQRYNDEPKSTIHDTERKYANYKPNEILPVVLVLIEGGIDAMKTVRSVLANNNHVVVIDGSGGAASFLSTCYQRATRCKHGKGESISRCKHGKRKSKGETSTLSNADENIQVLIDECFENDSEELKEEAKELEKCCLPKHKLIHIYSLKNATTKADELIQNAIFNTYTEYYDKEVANQRGSIYEEDLKINIEKKNWN
ncbi:unnamed protein product [Mytilus coruscus]|uniref:TRPM SLOG domain-containing protein n=1 Tax=Mytilus coruscus TaxID=42192 RepID=A0A6J8DQF8_MYTCO|nr:unnamed protein product [Mytilus coruscus]